MNPDELVELKAARIELLEKMYFQGKMDFDRWIRLQFDGGAVKSVLAIVALLEAIIHSQSVMVMNDGSINDNAGDAFKNYVHSAWLAAVDLSILLGQIPPFGDAAENDQAYARLKLAQEIDSIEDPQP